MKYTILGKKLGMTQVYDSANRVVPVTVVQAGPCPVLQVKTVAVDGYDAIQIGFDSQKDKNASKAALSHAKKAGVDAAPRVIREVRLDAASDRKAGDVLDVTGFEVGKMVDIIGVTKGKGFAGVVKRFRTAGGPASHGSMFHRRIGSIGQRQWPGHTFKNQKMPGHMGSKQRTVQNLEVVRVDAERNILLIRGSVPGANGDTVMIRSAIKAK